MVNVFVNIVGTKIIESITIVKVRRKAFRSIHGNKMSPTEYTIYMNDFKFPLTICAEIWLNNPQSSVFVGSV